jgi:hypothetical protein
MFQKFFRLIINFLIMLRITQLVFKRPSYNPVGLYSQSFYIAYFLIKESRPVELGL